MKPKLSVIIAIYKVEKYLRQCLDSAVNQTFEDLEIILVDDGSPDGCGAICDEYARRDPRVVVIHKPNGGLATAWNCGIDRASGEWITFLDSDDWIDPDYYERLFDSMDAKEADMLFANGRILELPDGSRVKRRTFAEPFVATRAKELDDLLIRTLVEMPGKDEVYLDFGYAWDKLYRASFLRENRVRVTTSIVAKCAWLDALFIFEAIDKARCIQGVVAAGYHYRIVDAGSTRRYNAALPAANIAFLHQIRDLAERRESKQALAQALHARAINAFAGCLRNCFFHPQNPDAPDRISEQIRAMKRDDIVGEAIRSRSDAYLGFKAAILKHALRLPWIWPLRALNAINAIHRRACRIH